MRGVSNKHCLLTFFIFRGLGSTGNYLRGAREQAHSFGDLVSPAKKQMKIRKVSILFYFLKISSASGGWS